VSFIIRILIQLLPIIWLNWTHCVRNDDIALLQKECKELVQVWLKLQRKHPECDELLPNSRKPPSVASLQQVIRSTLDNREAQQQRGFGRVKQQFFSFCDTLTAYSSLFSLIPQGSLYTSLFVGVISSLVKVSPVAGAWETCFILTDRERLPPAMIRTVRASREHWPRSVPTCPSARDKALSTQQIA
jgi:hypothetical protein